MSQRVLVTGGTGTLGRAVVRRLEADDRAVRVLSRRPPPEHPPGDVEWVSGDIGAGRGIEDAVAGADTIVHCARDGRHARRDLPGVRNFFDAARRAGVGHLVYISIVGIDRVPLGYYRVKLAEERMVEESGLGWSILRATQFHDLIRLVLSTLSVLPVLPVLPVLAGTSFQPVDVRDVAVRLAELAAGPPAGRVADLGGPQVRTFTDLARAYRRAAGVRRPVLPVPVPGRVSRAYRAGGHLAPAHADGRRTFEEYLAEWYPGGTTARS